MTATKLTGTIDNARLNAATTSSSGIVQLNDTLTSTSVTEALTANQGKALQDGKLSLTGGTVTGTTVIAADASSSLKVGTSSGFFGKLEATAEYVASPTLAQNYALALRPLNQPAGTITNPVANPVIRVLSGNATGAATVDFLTYDSSLRTGLAFNSYNGTAKAEGLRIKYNGNIGLGTIDPTEKLDVTGNIKSSGTITAGTGVTATTGNISASSGNLSSSGSVTAGNGLTVTTGNTALNGTAAQSTTFNYGATRTISVKNFDANNVVLDTSENGYNYIGTSAKRFWRGYFNTLDATTVDADTYVGLPVATTSLSGIVSTGTQTFAGSKTFNSALSLNGDNRASGTTGSRVHNFYNTATSSIAGGITITGSATVTYGQGSDYRLKENFEPLTGALNKLLSIPVYKFSWKSEPEKGKVDGFIAHEVQAIVPEAIIGQKDAVDEEGNPIYQQIDQSKLVPLLFKAVQELSLKVEALEARIQSLESGDK
jgi:hypothetical protein